MRPEKQKTKKLVQLSVLIALEILMAFTPIGYLKTPLIEITFMMIPVALGAVLIGVGASSILGIVFGITSYIQCFTGSIFGAAIVAISPFRAFVLCFLPRVLMGVLTGLLFRWFQQKKKDSMLSFAITSFSAAAMNTVFFVSLFFLFYRDAVLDLGTTGKVDISGMNLLAAFMFLAGVNGLVEIAVCTVLSTAIGKPLAKVLKQH